MIDLHTHTTESDGTDTPAELMRAAAAAGVSVLALTDHDTSAGWASAAAEVDHTQVTLIRGTEISCTAEGMSVHLLSYLHDPHDPALTAMFAASREHRRTRAVAMVERLSADMAITWEDVAAQATPSATIGRPHIADALVRLGLVEDRSAAFATILAPSGPYYVRYQAPAAASAVAAVRAAGGVPIMAHPQAHKRGRVVSREAIIEMIEAGLAGLEVDHRDHTDQARTWLRELAAEHDLLTTGSSDYHGRGKPNRLGEHTTSEHVLGQIIAQGRIEALRP